MPKGLDGFEDFFFLFEGVQSAGERQSKCRLLNTALVQRNKITMREPNNKITTALVNLTQIKLSIPSQSFIKMREEFSRISFFLFCWIKFLICRVGGRQSMWLGSLIFRKIRMFLKTEFSVLSSVHMIAFLKTRAVHVYKACEDME